MDTATHPRRPTARTADERREQLRFLAENLDDDRPTSEVVQLHMRQHGVSRRQAFRDIKVVRRRLLAKVLKVRGGRPSAVAHAERRLNRLFTLAIDANDIKVALKAEQARCRLLGLYPEQCLAAQFIPGPVRPDLHRLPEPAGTTATGAGDQTP